MTATIYLRGCSSDAGTHVVCPLPSSCVLFFLRYCQTQQFEVVFITTQVLESEAALCSEVPLSSLEGIPFTFASWEDAPSTIRNVCLPSVYQPEASLVRAGLCVILRHIIKTAHNEAPDRHLIDLLGFRQGSMRMCSEVSGWTKLCEVELSDSITSLIKSLKDLKVESEADSSSAERSLTLPLDLLKLEGHFKKKCRVHNDDKKRRAELIRLKNLLLLPSTDSEGAVVNGVGKSCSDDNAVIKRGGAPAGELTSSMQEKNSRTDVSSIQQSDARIEKLIVHGSRLEIELVVFLPHGVRRVRIDKNLDKARNKGGSGVEGVTSSLSALRMDSAALEKSLDSTEGSRLEEISELPRLADVVEKLTYLDIEYVHTYSEGVEMTLADLILFVYVYLFLENLQFDCSLVAKYIPSILQWAQHMASLPPVSLVAQGMGWDLPQMIAGLEEKLDGQDKLIERRMKVLFVLPEEPENDDEDEMELSRCAKMKHKAIKPEVFQAFKKLEEAEIKPETGDHPRGEEVTVAWDRLPAGVHPREGDVPEKRTKRKCQQLENLVTAVQAVAKPGDSLIDFCSGGGHLGIVMAYLLPDCQVYLVENKEESLLKVCSRLESLALKNVTLYQCNIDYFIGKFNVGVCLHACGSATDMVLQLCLDAGASFVICPCCYGSIHKTHLLNYPRSKQFQGSSITYKDFLTLGHAADQTEFNIALEGQGRECMNLVDSDRAEYARELGYKVTLCSLQPLSCTPKNNLLVGTPA